jgi:hypothetical protein
MKVQWQVKASAIMRRLVKESTIASIGSDIKLAKDFIELAGRSLTIASGFEQNDIWTIGIYCAQKNQETGVDELICVAQTRAIICDIAKARVWQTGLGVIGVTFQNKKPQIIPNMFAPELQNIFSIDGERLSGDNSNYKSMVAYPIIPTSSEVPWGVATATSDRMEHFNHNGEGYLNHEEPIKVLADFMALAISIREAYHRHTDASLPAVTSGD